MGIKKTNKLYFKKLKGKTWLYICPYNNKKYKKYRLDNLKI